MSSGWSSSRTGLTVQPGEKVTLCLNGYELSFTGDYSITVPVGASLEIYGDGEGIEGRISTYHRITVYGELSVYGTRITAYNDDAIRANDYYTDFDDYPSDDEPAKLNIKDCFITTSASTQNQSYDGLDCRGRTQATIEGTYIQGISRGIYCETDATVDITSCKIYGYPYAIEIEFQGIGFRPVIPDDWKHVPKVTIHYDNKDATYRYLKDNETVIKNTSIYAYRSLSNYHGVVTIYDGTVYGVENSAYGEIYLYGGAIKANGGVAYAHGVWNRGGATFTMSEPPAGEKSDDWEPPQIATTYAYGIYAERGTINIFTGSVTTSNRSAIYIEYNDEIHTSPSGEERSSKVELNLKNSPTIKGSTGSGQADIYIEKGITITLDDDLSLYGDDQYRLYVSGLDPENGDQWYDFTSTDAEHAVEYNIPATDNFVSLVDDYEVRYHNNENHQIMLYNSTLVTLDYGNAEGSDADENGYKISDNSPSSVRVYYDNDPAGTRTESYGTRNEGVLPSPKKQDHTFVCWYYDYGDAEKYQEWLNNEGGGAILSELLGEENEELIRKFEDNLWRPVDADTKAIEGEDHTLHAEWAPGCPHQLVEADNEARWMNWQYDFIEDDDDHHTRTCLLCGHVCTDDSDCGTYGTDHLFDGDEAWTDSEDGEHHHKTCSLCEYDIEEEHSVDNWVQYDEGEEDREEYHHGECTVCRGDAKEEHSISEWKPYGAGEEEGKLYHHGECFCGYDVKEEHSEGEWVQYEEGDDKAVFHHHECSVCHDDVKQPHQIEKSEWYCLEEDDGKHYMDCYMCGEERIHSAEHTTEEELWKDPDGEAAEHETKEGSHRQECTAEGCEAVLTEEHDYIIETDDRQEATADEDGYQMWQCKCGALYREVLKYEPPKDDKPTEPVDPPAKPDPPATSSTTVTASSAGTKEPETVYPPSTTTTEFTVTTEPLPTSEGIVSEPSQSEAPTVSGSVIFRIEAGEGAPDVSLDDQSIALLKKNAVERQLTEEQRYELLNNGGRLEIVMKIAAVDMESGSIRQERQLVRSLADQLSYTEGQYLSVEIIKILNGQYIGNIHELDSPVRVTFTLPRELKGKDRSFAAIRVHEGEAKKLTDRDNAPDTLTVLSDRFSVYAIVYSESTSDPTNRNPVTGNQIAGLAMPLLVSIVGALTAALWQSRKK